MPIPIDMAHHTILGKGVALFLIVVATWYNWVYGVFVCALIVYFYYQVEYPVFPKEPLPETFIPIEDNNHMKQIPSYSPYTAVDMATDFTYKPAEAEPDTETVLDTVEVNSVLHSYLRRPHISNQ